MADQKKVALVIGLACNDNGNPPQTYTIVFKLYTICICTCSHMQYSYGIPKTLHGKSMHIRTYTYTYQAKCYDSVQSGAGTERRSYSHLHQWHLDHSRTWWNIPYMHARLPRGQTVGHVNDTEASGGSNNTVYHSSQFTHVQSMYINACMIP